MRHGIMGPMGQDVIDSTKHIMAASELAAVYEWLKDPTNCSGESKSIVERRIMEKNKDYIEVGTDDAQRTARVDHLKAAFRLCSGEIEKIEDLGKHNEQYRVYQQQSLDALMGRGHATYLDFARISSELDEGLGSFKIDPVTGHSYNIGEIETRTKSRFNFNDMVSSRPGKFALGAAAAFLAANMFFPTDTASSINDRTSNIFSSDLQLDRDIPLDSVSASQEQVARIEMNSNSAYANRDRSSFINTMLGDMTSIRTDSIREIKTYGRKNWSRSSTINYGAFGTSNDRRRYTKYSQ
jgi:hypothetical protein